MRFSLRTLAVLVAGLAVIFAALFFASPLWTRIVFTAVLFGMLASIIGIVYRTGARRAFWVGFAIVGCAFCSLYYTGIMENRMAIAPVLDALHDATKRTVSERKSQPILGKVVPGRPTRRFWMESRDIPAKTDFREVGHLLSIPLLAMLGGFLAAYLYSRPYATSASHQSD
jgi:hypothetical protein